MRGIPQGHPLEISPRELWLEHRVERLEAELYQREGEASLPRFSVHAEADEIVMPERVDPFHLLVAGSMERSSQGLHVRTTTWMNAKKVLRNDYLVNSTVLESLSESMKAQLMVNHHQKMVFNVGRELWSS